MLERFLECQLPPLANRNLGTAAAGKAYKRMKASLKLPADFVHRQADGRLMRHFYSAEERKHFAVGWSGVPSAESAGPVALKSGP